MSELPQSIDERMRKHFWKGYYLGVLIGCIVTNVLRDTWFS